MKVLVTSGAGYIGSHIVLQLGESGHDVTVLDDLSSGHEWAVSGGRLIIADICDYRAVHESVGATSADAVIHLAAVSNVRESLDDPAKYFRTNVQGTLNVAEACASHNVRSLVFSSSAAVYGAPGSAPITEDVSLAPISPYGTSKMMAEHIIEDVCAAHHIRAVTLRYFNVAGADPKGRTSETSPEAWHLIKVACEAALGTRDALEIFGTDFSTPDGTCIRDYIHVEDVATAHVQALEYLQSDGESQTVNLGYGRGVSVRQAVSAVQKCAGVDFPVIESNRRPGDPAVLVANPTRAHDILHWSPKFDSIHTIVQTALAWERKYSHEGP